MEVFQDIRNDETGEVEKTADDARAEFVDHIVGEIKNSFSSLTPRFEKLDKWRRLREGITEVKKKNYPFPNSSNVMTPLTMWLCQTVYGEMRNTFAVREPFWMVKAMYKDPGLIEKAKVLSKYFNIISKSPTDLNLNSKNDVMHYEADTLGTCYVKYPYVKRTWNFVTEDTGGAEKPVEVTSHDGLDIITYSEESVFFPVGCTDLQNAPWVAFIDSYFEHDLKMLEDDGIFLDVDRVIESEIGDSSYFRENKDRDSERLGMEVDVDGLYDVAEVYAFWDVNGDGKPEDIIVNIHLSSGTVLSEQYNKIGRRPFGAMKYMFVPYQMPGRGVCQMVEHMQDEADTVHNMRIDNNKFANQNVLQIKNGSDLKPNETVYPGKIFPVDTVGDVAPLQLGKMEYASVTEENLATTYAQRASGVSEIMAGFADSTLKSRDTFGGQQLRLQQGKGMFSAIVDNKIRFYDEMGLIMYYQLIHHREEVMEKERKIMRMPDEDLAILEEALNIPIDQIPLKLQFQVRTRNIEETKDVQRNNMLMFSQLLDQYTQTALQASMMLNNPQQPLPPEAHAILTKSLEGKTRILQDILELMAVEDTADYVLDADAMEEAHRAEEAQKRMMMLKQSMQMQLMGPQMGPQIQGGQNGQSNGSLPQAAANNQGTAGGMG